MRFKVQVEVKKTIIQFVECEFAEDAVELARNKTMLDFGDFEIDSISVFDPDDEVGFSPPILEITDLNASR